MAADGNQTSQLKTARYMQPTPSALLPVSQGKRRGREKMKKAPNTKMSSEIGLWITDHLALDLNQVKVVFIRGHVTTKNITLKVHSISSLGA